MSSLKYFIPDDAINFFSKHNDDDKFDKLCRKYTAIMMLVLIFFWGPYKILNNNSGITCWCHNEYSDPHCKVITNFCYVSEKYIPPANNTNLPSMKTVLSHRINYYQWVVYLFVLLACLSYVPSFIW